MVRLLAIFINKVVNNMAGAKIKALNNRTSHMTNNEIADRKAVQDALRNNYDSIGLDVPKELTGYAKKEWLKIIPLLKQMTPASNLDRSQLINYCLLAQTVFDCQKHIKHDGLVVDNGNGNTKTNPYFTIQDKAIKNMKSIAIEFGMTINSRAKLENSKVKNNDVEDPFATFLGSDVG